LGFKFNRTKISQTGVESDAVVEGFDIIEDCGTSMGEVAEAVMINQFVFEGAKEGLHEGPANAG
jgi:hypothetical protein